MVMRQIVMLVLLFGLALFVCACTSKCYYCDHCKQWTDTHNRLVSGIDMELCGECYATYLAGKWDINNSNDE